MQSGKKLWFLGGVARLGPAAGRRSAVVRLGELVALRLLDQCCAAYPAKCARQSDDWRLKFIARYNRSPLPATASHCWAQDPSNWLLVSNVQLW